MINSVTVVGLGYIGLPTALLIAKSGITTHGFDVDHNKLEQLKKGDIYFDEKDIAAIFSEAQEYFKVSEALEPSDVYIIAVPTPVMDGAADLSYVMEALKTIKSVARDGDLIIVESTVGPADCLQIIMPEIASWQTRCLFAQCTERAIPGNTIDEMINNDRVIGANDDAAAQKAVNVYKSFVCGEVTVTDVTTAAVTKVMENTYRSVNIALANELATLANKLNFNVWEAIALANRHPRVNIHLPGPGVGGHCIPVDPYFLVDKERKISVVREGLKMNESMAEYIVQSLMNMIAEYQINDVSVAILGYAYKKNVDDGRESPAERVIQQLESENIHALVTDPFVERSDFVPLQDALKNANIVLLVTDHDEYKKIDFSQYDHDLIIDTKNFLTNLADADNYFLLGKNL